MEYLQYYNGYLLKKIDFNFIMFTFEIYTCIVSSLLRYPIISVTFCLINFIRIIGVWVSIFNHLE